MIDAKKLAQEELRPVALGRISIWPRLTEGAMEMRFQVGDKVFRKHGWISPAWVRAVGSETGKVYTVSEVGPEFIILAGIENFGSSTKGWNPRAFSLFSRDCSNDLEE